MRVAEAAKLFSASAVWRATGAARAGRELVRGLRSADENCRLIAGTLLVKGGSQAASLLRAELRSRRPTPLILRVIGDAGARELAAEIESFAGDADPQLASAARDALQALRSGA